MLIAHVYFTVAAGDRQKALDTLLAEAPAVRAMKGCESFVPFTDPTGPDRVGILHEWHDGEDFAAYLSSPAFTVSSRILRPLMTSAPVSRRFDAALLETVN